MRIILFFVIIFFVLWGCKKKESSCEDREKIYSYLTDDEKKWLQFSSADSLFYEDSLLNERFFVKTSQKDSTYTNCNFVEEHAGAVFTSDSCPLNFNFTIAKTVDNFIFHLSTGIFDHNQNICSSFFNYSSSNGGGLQLDSVILRSRKFYDVIKFEDTERTLYFTKSDGIEAFTVDSILWIKTI